MSTLLSATNYPLLASFYVDAPTTLCHYLESLRRSCLSRRCSCLRCDCRFTGDLPIGLRVSILASGSAGNLTLLETENTRILVDAGLGKRETLARLAAVGRDIDSLDAVLITHEHADH